MYEEEDDDLPAQYRRLTAHLNTNSSDFNRRLATYLTNHVAMRQALDQALSNSYAQTGQNWSPNSQNNQHMQAPWTQNQPMFGQGMHHGSPSMIQPSMMHHQSPTGQVPNSLPNARAFNADPATTRPSSMSTNTIGNITSSPSSSLTTSVGNFHNADEHRRNTAPSTLEADSSRPTNDASVASLGQNASVSPPQPSVSTQTQAESRSSPFIPAVNNDQGIDFQSDLNSQQFPNPFLRNMAQSSPWPNSPQMMTPTSPFSSLTTSLPPETQMFLGGGFNFNGDQMNQQPFYSYNPNIANKKLGDQASAKNVSQNMASDAFDSKLETAWPTPPSMSNEDLTSPFTAVGNAKFGAETQIPNDMTSQSMFASTPGDGLATPVDEFSALIDSTLWDNETPA